MRHELYVLQEPLTQAGRVGNPSPPPQADREEQRQWRFEMAWITSRTVGEMEPEEFRAVFRGELRNPDAHTPEMLLCEKALLLSSPSLLRSDCAFFALDLLDLVLQKPDTRRILKERYHVTQHDVYRMTGETIIFDEPLEIVAEDFRRMAAELRENVAAVERENVLLRQAL